MNDRAPSKQCADFLDMNLKAKERAMSATLTQELFDVVRERGVTGDFHGVSLKTLADHLLKYSPKTLGTVLRLSDEDPLLVKQAKRSVFMALLRFHCEERDVRTNLHTAQNALRKHYAETLSDSEARKEAAVKIKELIGKEEPSLHRKIKERKQHKRNVDQISQAALAVAVGQDEAAHREKQARTKGKEDWLSVMVSELKK